MTNKPVCPADAVHSGWPRNRFAGIASLFLSGVLILAVQTSSAHADGDSRPTAARAPDHYSQANPIPPRQQWTANFGYCGEVALISAGLYYGQYVSQYDARAVASRNMRQSKAESQLLLGVNDSHAAAQLHLNAVEWRSTATPNANDFLAWVKRNAAAGYPVAIGVFENLHAFEGKEDPNAGDAEYDHIALVTGVSSKRPLSGASAYDKDDVIAFSDHGLWSPSGQAAFYYRYAFGAFQASRAEANAKTGPIYSLARGGRNYGLAITGIIDHDGKTLPVRLTTSRNDERPAMTEGSDTRPAAGELTLTATVSGLKPGVPYTLYRYDDLQSVPDAAFNAKVANASRKWKIAIAAGSTFSVKEKISSNQIAVYRAVPDTAP